jgi:hypothetical protein
MYIIIYQLKIILTLKIKVNCYTLVIASFCYQKRIGIGHRWEVIISEHDKEVK